MRHVEYILSNSCVSPGPMEVVSVFFIEYISMYSIINIYIYIIIYPLCIFIIIWMNNFIPSILYLHTWVQRDNDRFNIFGPTRKLDLRCWVSKHSHVPSYLWKICSLTSCEVDILRWWLSPPTIINSIALSCPWAVPEGQLTRSKRQY